MSKAKQRKLSRQHQGAMLFHIRAENRKRKKALRFKRLLMLLMSGGIAITSLLVWSHYGT